MRTRAKKYNFSAIEKKWAKIWREEKIYEPDFSSRRGRGKFYNLMMFPYPSAEGLHVGNMYAFAGSDIYGRFKRMRGYDVFEPIGLDGFGIHSENYALKIGTHPARQAAISEKRFYKQLESVGNGFSWNERLETYKPEYYKWTQWIFTEMWRRGLAYRKKQAVNWCPSCKTVLADEQVLQKSQIRNSKSQTNLKSEIRNLKQEAAVGVCERCETPVLKKELEQWFFRITKYADKLLENLEKIDWSERVKIAQRNWIGKSEGVLIKFEVRSSKSETSSKSEIKNFEQANKAKKLEAENHIEVFTTRPDTLFGATYLVLAPEHPWLEQEVRNTKSEILNKSEVQKYRNKAKRKTEEERIENKEKTGVELKGIKAINPANGEEIPIFVGDYVFSGYGTGAIMAVPAHDKRDFEFAKKFHLPVKQVICQNYPAKTCPILKEAYEGDGFLVGSGKFDGMNSEEAKKKIAKFVGGKMRTQFRLRDWLISRQRYWGPPIPIIYCRKCREIRNLKFEIRNEFKTKNSKLREGIDYAVFDGKEYIIHVVPEKDLPVVLPQIRDFRPKGTGKSPLASLEKFCKVKCPVCGGDARRETDVSDTFLDSAWYYIGFLAKTSSLKPARSAGGFEIRNSKFKSIAERWLPVDMYIGGAEHSVLHLLYVRFLAMALKDAGVVSFEEPFPKFRAHGLLVKEGAKMSKSKGNIVTPDEYIKRFGADVFRMYLMFLSPFEQGGDFRDKGILGIDRFLRRVWKLYQQQTIDNRQPTTHTEPERIVHQTIKKVTEDIENLRYNTAISALMTLLNEFENYGEVPHEHLKVFLKLLAPFAPFISEELWSQFPKNSKQAGGSFRGKTGRANAKYNSIHKEKWPEYDPKKIIEKHVTIVVQVNGKVRDQFAATIGLGEKETVSLALEREKIKRHTEEKNIKRIVYVKDKLVNIVL